MRQLLTVFRNNNPLSGAFMNQVTLRRAACLMAVGTVIALTQTFAKDPAPTDAKSTSKIKPPSATAAEPAIPACLEKLKLTQPQQDQAREIVGKYDATLDTVWKQFGEKYMETVRTEVALLAAIEDNLTEAQRTQVRDQRRKVAHAEKALEGTSAKPNQAKASPVDAAEQVIAGVGISLTDEQEAAADATQQKYASRLRSLNRDIEGLHTRLVSLEADKLVELEKMLTKEQLAQLREARQTGSAEQKLTSTDKASKSSN
jgi:hypothetical protein